MGSMDIFLEKHKSKKSVNQKKTLHIELKGDKKLLPEGVIDGSVDSFLLYNNERMNCNKIRLICTINPMCTNILFNPVTEIVKNEGGSDVISLNYNPIISSDILNILVKPSDFEWNNVEAIRDTQLSSSEYGFEYHCGIDIFNNHILRNLTYKSVRYPKSDISHEDSVNFNTIDDYLRSYDGTVVTEDAQYTTSTPSLKPGTISNTYTGYVSMHRTHAVSYYTVSPSISFEYAPPLGQELTVNIYCSYDVVINGNTIPSYTSFNSKLVGDGSTTYFYLPRKVLDYEGTSEGYEMINGNGFVTGIYPSSDSMYTYVNSDTNERNFIKIIARHLYQPDEIYTFNDSVLNLLYEKDGWFGFNNKMSLPTSKTDLINNSDKLIDISKPINYNKSCDFIDMYPDRTLFSFSPKFNERRNRAEHNWKYCLTYPSSSTTEGFSFMNQELNSLKILYFDEFVKDDNGLSLITFYCITQHGLREGDYVNIYSTYNGENEKLFNLAEVYRVYDKYIFSIVKTDKDISNQWSDNQEDTIIVKDDNNNDVTLEFDYPNGYRYVDKSLATGTKYYYVVKDTGRVNVDPKSQNLSFKRVSQNGIECKYYVRIFSRIPNFKFCDKEINDNTLNSSDSNLIHDYAFEEFDNHVNKLAFSKNIFNDSICEIVYTDDIDVSYLKDNLGRPLSDIYFTVVKNNAGFKKWYGKYGNDIVINDSDIEYSHCFGENTCSFQYSDEAMHADVVNDIRNINNFDSNRNGFDMYEINKKTYGISVIKRDEIIYDLSENFYGDLCCYSPIECYEEIIQPIMNRFNTAQRELTTLDTSFQYFSSITTNEIVSGDYSSDGYSSTTNTHLCTPRKEGYYYKMHYPITFRTIASELKSKPSMNYTIISLYITNKSTINGDYQYMLNVNEDVSFVKNSKFILYSKSKNEIYYCKVTKLYTSRKMLILIYDENNNIININTTDISDYVLCYNDDAEIPKYANIIKDGSCRYYWRDVLSNGFDDNATVENYPYANDAIYITKSINFYLKRQDKNGDCRMRIYNAKRYVDEYEPNGVTYYNNVIFDNYNEEMIKEC